MLSVFVRMDQLDNSCLKLIVMRTAMGGMIAQHVALLALGRIASLGRR